MNTLYGIHFNGSPSEHLDDVRMMQPAVVVLLHPDAQQVQDIRAASPETIIVGRQYWPDHNYEEAICQDPEDAARRAHEYLMANEQDWIGLVDVVQTHNENCQDEHWPDGHEPARCERKAIFDKTWMQIVADAGYPYRCGVHVSSVGRPPKIEDDGGVCFNALQSVAALAYRLGHYVLVHEYAWKNDLWSPDDNYIGRYFTYFWSRFSNPEARKARVIFSEFGFDGLIEGIKVGWKGTDLSAEQVAQQLHDKHYDLVAWRNAGMHLLGAALYCLCTDDWSMYDFTEPLTIYINNHIPENVPP